MFGRNASHKLAKVALVYVKRDMTNAIVNGLYYAGATWSEPHMVDVIEGLDTRILGAAAHQRWSNCEAKRYKGPTRKATEAPAFLASNSKSVAAFQREYVWYRLKGANEANLYIEVHSQPGDDEIELMTTLGAHDSDKLGERIVRLHERFLAWEQLK